jgi:serine/threonine-protein kinase
VIRTDSAEKQTLDPRMVDAAIARLRWVSLTCAVLTGLLVYLEALLQPENRHVLRGQTIPVWLFVVLVSLGFSALGRYRLLPPLAILNLGLVFEVVVAAAISVSETALPRWSDAPVMGASKVAIWIGVVGLVIPNRPWIKFVTALASASTWPLAYLVSVHLHGRDPLAWNRLLMWVHVPYVMAFVNYAISKRMWHMENAVQKARDLGSYQLVSLIGSGGMGEVWRARHRMLARDAAIKVVRSDLMLLQRGYESDITRKRFAQEAAAMASLQSPHTVHLYDFGVADDGSFYYVMELLDGISLQALVDKFGPQPAPRVIYMLRQVCDSLEEAHRRGLVHRDIKPNNIFACMVGLEHDFMKVLDFGLVKNLSRNDGLQLTLSGVTAGTPAYMPPEVATGDESIDGRADLYGLGCVAYFLLTGAPVFDEKTPTASAMAHVQKTPTPPSLRSETPIPPELESLVLRCLAKRPEDRPQSALELSRLLAAIPGGPEWTQGSAERWWQTYLPVSCSFRAARQLRPADAGRGRQRAEAGAYGVAI